MGQSHIELDSLAMTKVAAALWGLLGDAERSLLNRAFARWLDGTAGVMSCAMHKRWCGKHEFTIYALAVEDAEFLIAEDTSGRVILANFSIQHGVGTTVQQ
jgi:hypothetical protein